jgi:hypothetical protein
MDSPYRTPSAIIPVPRVSLWGRIQCLFGKHLPLIKIATLPYTWCPRAYWYFQCPRCSKTGRAWDPHHWEWVKPRHPGDVPNWHSMQQATLTKETDQ